MEFRVLGPVEAKDAAGDEVDLGGPQQRLVLALLLSHAGYVVSTEQLMADIWGDEPPATARKTIQGYVSILRRALATSEMLVSREPGYVLDVDPEQVDALRFEGLVSSAREQIVTDAEEGRSMLREALALWSGAPYEDLQDVDALRPEITRLEQLRLVALEDRVHADIVCGHSSLVIPELETLVRAHPLREEMRVLLVLALYRAGRQAEALRAVEDARRHMAEEIGVNASPRLQLLEQRILNHDEVLDGPDPLSPLAVVSPAAGTEPTRNPYRGLQAFTEEDAADFFGRDDLVRRLRLALDRRGVPRLVVLAGPSGSGKSSAVRAGLLSGLIAEARDVASMYPGIQPASALGRTVADLGGEGSVLVVDQFEEVFTLVPDRSERAAFLTAIADLVTSDDSPWIVATIRADYLDELLGHAELAALLEEALMLVPPMSEHEIRSAVVGPAQGVGVGVEPELVANITGDIAAQMSALPLLQYALTDLFDRRDGGPLTRDAYRAAGGLLGALARRADELYSSLDESGRATARRAFLRMVSVTSDGEPVRKRVGRSDLADLAQADGVLDAFGTHRLVTFDRTPEGVPTVEVAHEALLGDWPILRNWIEEARIELVAHRRLAEAAADWESHDRHTDYLLTGTRLAQYGDWPLPDVSLSQTELGFLIASRGHSETRRRAQRRRRRVTFVGLAGAAVIALGLAAVALQERREAERERVAAEQSQAAAEQSQAAAEQSQATAEARAIVNEALLQVGQDQELALLLSIEAYRADSRLVGPLLSALANVTVRSSELSEAGHNSPVLSDRQIGQQLQQIVNFPLLCAVELGPGRFYTKPKSGEAVIADVVTGSVARVTVPYECRATLSPEGDRLVGSVVPPVRVHIVDASTGKQLVAVDDRVVRAQWGPDGRILGIMGGLRPDPFDMGAVNSRSELVWVDPDTGSIDPTGIMAVDFDWSPDGSRVLITDAPDDPDDILPARVSKTILESTSLEVIAEIGEVEPAAATTAWSRDGRYVGDVSRSGVIRVWDTATGTDVVRRATGENATEGAWIAFSPRGDTAAVARSGAFEEGRGGEIEFFEIPSGRSTGSPVAFSVEIAATSFVDDTRLAVVRYNGIIEVLDLASNPLVESTIGVSTVSSRLDELLAADVPGGLRLFPDRGDYATVRAGPEVTVLDLETEEQWVVEGVANDSVGRWVRTDGKLVVISRDFEMAVYDSAGTEVARGYPFGSVSLAEPDFRLVTLEGDTVAAVVVSRTHQFGNPEELIAGAIDLMTLEAVGSPATFELPSGTTQFFVGPTRLVAYNFGAGTMRTFALDGTEAGPVIKLDFIISNSVVSADGTKALVTGPEMTGFVDLTQGTVLSTAPVFSPAPGIFLPGGLTAFGLPDGRLAIWSTDPLELIGVLSERDPSALFGFVVFKSPSHVWFDTGSQLEHISVDPEQWANRACELAGRSLTEEEWVRFVSPERPYEPAC